ncbi:HdeD family acid-resistance protein [Nocardia aurantiaca]|uniref:DUF308 domain-containing protein n=1 Tax=Nocardia aurantiaca TaxID=2675850 RepID=A0A6I3L6K1_9NOCA|nr:DUF308 domain-containing protein [Nocardia aurantiaca]MTE16304.1 DUF308 domain-containing protein [Nocardia aurantiaca]
MPANRIEGRTDVFADWAWQSLVVTGGCSVVLGAVMAVWPDKSQTVAGILYGLVLLASAAMQLVIAFGARIATALKVLEVASAIIALVLAAWAFNSGEWVALLSLWIGMCWVLRGIVQALVGVWSEQYAGAGRLELVGLLTLAAGVIVAVVPFETLAALSIAVGLMTMALGVSEILLGARVERNGSDIPQLPEISR